VSEETGKQSEEAKVKWAAEAYAFLSLFSRLRNRLYGLLMLELGWGLLVRLVLPLSDGSNSGAHSAAAAHAPTGISALEVFLIGAAAIALYWLLSSGCLKIACLCFARVGRPLMSNVLVGSFLLIGIMTLPFYGLAILVDFVRFIYWQKRNYPDARLDAMQTKIAAPSLQEIYEKERKSIAETPTSFEHWKISKGNAWISGEETRIALPVLNNVFKSEVKWHADWLWTFSANLVGRWRTQLDSMALVGLAPFHSYSFEEEQKSAKAPLQIFAAAIRRLRLGLFGRKIVNHIRFIVIPDIVSVESEETARWWRALLGLDTLLWGSYLSTSPPRIWLNLESKLQLKDEPNKAEDDERAEVDWDPMRPEDLDFAMLEINQDDPIECYLVILVCFLRTLQLRPKPQKFLFWEARDALAWKHSSGEMIFLRLVRPIISRLDGLPPRGLDNTPTQMLVAYLSNWAAHLLSWSPKDNEVWLAREMLWHCARLAPTEPLHHYRLGALLCFLGEEVEARKAFAKAQELDRNGDFYDPDRISSSAGVYLYLAYNHLSDIRGRTASAVASVARGLALGGKEAAGKIAEQFIETKYWKEQKVFAECGEEPNLSATERILSSMLNLDWPVPVPPSQPTTAT
jgi:hypothetical protein